ncbi:MAG TPA: c-type cytochrome [Steroidobacteraceae bacterium]|nr:c-type cytochrome [Steroidobacteraceae bacterium]
MRITAGPSRAAGAKDRRRQGLIWGIATAAALLCGFSYWLHLRSLEAELVRRWPADLVRDPAMLHFAVSLARPVYAGHCASCHGANLHGDHASGAPDLADSVWLYGDGGIGDIENTILYGVRSGHPKSHNVTDMPAEGRLHQLSASEVDDVVEFVLALSRQPHAKDAAERGRQLFYDKGNCFDCHASDAMGNTDYGAPSLLGPHWNYGGDRRTLRTTIYSGRHGRCPAWISVLTPPQIRALAIYLYVESRPS